MVVMTTCMVAAYAVGAVVFVRLLRHMWADWKELWEGYKKEKSDEAKRA